MAADDFRKRADAVREIPLEVVLPLWNGQRDPRDRAQWRTEKGPLSVTGAQFFNWHLGHGGGGAIDLVMHLAGWSPRQAVDWLWRQLGPAHAAPHTVINSLANDPGRPSNPPRKRPPLRLPVPSPRHFDRVRRYLHEQRRVSLDIVHQLHDAGMLTADERGNAVFRMVAGQPPRTIGAELRGTTEQVWHGMAPGTRRDIGFFWIGKRGATTIVLCESAIDAISCSELRPSPVPDAEPLICISTAGVRRDAPWLRLLVKRGYTIHCGFDDDPPGHAAAARMVQRYPQIQRLLPPAHDWNDALRASR